MTLIPWKTKHHEGAGRDVAPLSGFRTEMDRLFDTFFGGAVTPWRGAEWGPPLDVEETDKEVRVRAEIPGVKPDDLEISISGNALVISGEKKESKEKRDKGYFYQERRYGSFYREVPLPTAVDEDNVQAEYNDGILSVTLKKSEEALPKKIQVKAK